MADYYFHYTSRIAAQMIIASGIIRPNQGGIVYLADELFPTGAQAANLLAIPVVGPVVSTPTGVVPLTKPVDVVCCIPANRLLKIVPLKPEDVDQFRDERTKEVIYHGGGRQFKYPGSINIRDLPWMALGSP